MMSKYVASLSTSKPAAAETIIALKATMAAMKISKSEMAPIILDACDTHLTERPSVLGKLLFIAERVVGANAAEPIRAKLPYGDEYVEALQRMLLEKAYKAAVLAGSDDLMTATVPADAAVLEMTPADAQGWLAEWQKEEADSRRQADTEADEADESERARRELLARVKAESDPIADTPGSSSSSDLTPKAAAKGKSYECSNCGYTLFPAVGREEKFFGEDFKCPKCGSAKDQFKDVSDE
mmetsp:Transcript_22414/g.56874  ORF Transcript_22414/g.56874 Transcript_22414/m.56874 type:complete len:240 (-) Transcript_22414:317-1036(-)